MCVTQTVLCAVVLTSPVLAMATYTASEPPTCANNVCNANCVVCSGADLPGSGHGHLHRLRAAHLRYQCGRCVDQGVLSYHHQEHSRQVLKNRLFIFIAHPWYFLPGRSILSPLPLTFEKCLLIRIQVAARRSINLVSYINHSALCLSHSSIWISHSYLHYFSLKLTTKTFCLSYSSVLYMTLPLISLPSFTYCSYLSVVSHPSLYLLFRSPPICSTGNSNSDFQLTKKISKTLKKERSSAQQQSFICLQQE
jgi:hypothetical protein